MAITYERDKLISLCPANTDEAQLYLVGANSETCIDAVLRVVNTDTVDRTYRIAHCDSAHGNNAAATKDFIAYDVTISPNSPAHEYGVHAKATQPIRIKASIADKVVFHLSGNKITVA